MPVPLMEQLDSSERYHGVTEKSNCVTVGGCGFRESIQRLRGRRGRANGTLVERCEAASGERTSNLLVYTLFVLRACTIYRLTPRVLAISTSILLS